MSMTYSSDLVDCGTDIWLAIPYRRMGKEYECTMQTGETLIELAMIRLLLARLGLRAYWQAKHTLNALRSS